MCMITADIYIALCSRASESASFISTKRVNNVCLSPRAWQSSFPVACCLVFSGYNCSLRLQRTQPIPSSLSLLRTCVLPFPCTCGASLSLSGLREDTSGLSPSILHTSFSSSLKLRSAEGCLRESVRTSMSVPGTKGVCPVVLCLGN